MQNTVVKEFENHPEVTVAIFNEGGEQNETREWLETWWDNYYLRGSVIFDETGDVSLTHYEQPSTGLPFGRGFIIQQDGTVFLPYFGYDPQFIIDTIYTLVEPVATPTPFCVHNGDVNFSGDITAGDSQLAFQIVLGSYSPAYEEECAADCNDDGNVTAGDAQQIFVTALGSGTCSDPLLY